ncbi:hypothetical protein GCM10010912_49800 [Paenibacillus albidus]|uniref:Uncharacterized protein n=1 Tax=Paenibacillus albidus TaxID=2041023 RepID=A0A917FT10_9BACL|nr:hypothetical protein GCM10010912_49800 [Paenibacillus albidus]
MDHPVLYLVPAALIVVTLMLAVFHSALRRKLYGRIYQELKSKLGMNASYLKQTRINCSSRRFYYDFKRTLASL